MDIQWPLVLFSLVAGTGGSLFAFVGLSELLGGSDKTRDAGAACSAVLLALGGCLSVLHLAAPLHAISAVTNLLSFSGISIELMLLGANFAIMVAYLLVRRRSKATAPLRVLSVLGIVLGLMLGYFCGHGYVIEGQPHVEQRDAPPRLPRQLACVRRVPVRAHQRPEGGRRRAGRQAECRRDGCRRRQRRGPCVVLPLPGR